MTWMWEGLAVWMWEGLALALDFLRSGFLGAMALTGGILFYYLLYRLFRFFWQLRLPPERRRSGGHPFRKTSGRGRTGYVLLCLEGALNRFGQTEEDWGWLLRPFWALTEAPEEDMARCLFHACQLLPVNVLPYEQAAEITASALYPDLMELWDTEEPVSEEDFSRARGLYIRAGWRMCLLEPLLCTAYRLADLSWAGGRRGRAQGLALLERAEGLLEDWDVPLPEGEAARLLQKQRSSGWGPPLRGERSRLGPPEPEEDGKPKV